MEISQGGTTHISVCVCMSVSPEDTVVAVSVTGILKVWIITAEVSRMQVYRRGDVTLSLTQNLCISDARY